MVRRGGGTGEDIGRDRRLARIAFQTLAFDDGGDGEGQGRRGRMLRQCPRSTRTEGVALVG